MDAEMAEFQLSDASLRRLNAAVTVVVCATVAGIAYWYERDYRRWSEQHHLFAAPRPASAYEGELPGQARVPDRAGAGHQAVRLLGCQDHTIELVGSRLAGEDHEGLLEAGRDARDLGGDAGGGEDAGDRGRVVPRHA